MSSFFEAGLNDDPVVHAHTPSSSMRAPNPFGEVIDLGVEQRRSLVAPNVADNCHRSGLIVDGQRAAHFGLARYSTTTTLLDRQPQAQPSPGVWRPPCDSRAVCGAGSICPDDPKSRLASRRVVEEDTLLWIARIHHQTSKRLNPTVAQYRDKLCIPGRRQSIMDRVWLKGPAEKLRGRSAERAGEEAEPTMADKTNRTIRITAGATIWPPYERGHMCQRRGTTKRARYDGLAVISDTSGSGSEQLR